MSNLAPHTHADVLIAAIEPIHFRNNIDRLPEAVLTYFVAFVCDQYLCSVHPMKYAYWSVLLLDFLKSN